MTLHTFADRVSAVRDYLAQNPGHGRRRITRALGISSGSVSRCLAAIKNNQSHETAREGEARHFIELDQKRETACASSLHPSVRTLDDLLKATKVDLSVWEVERHTVNKWEMAMKQESRSGRVSAVVQPLFQVKAWLKRKAPEIAAGQKLIEKIEAAAPILDVPAIRMRKLEHKRALEICIMDPHIGLLCQKPEADGVWDIDRSAAHIMEAIRDLVVKASHFGPFEQVFMPFGNDFVHVDNLEHTTSGGTPQPEAVAFHALYERAEGIAIEMVDRLRPLAKEIFIYEVPGNHSRVADYTLARILRAYYHHDKNVHVDASASPYKFHRYGTTLIGYEHGHSVSQIRLAALMANERRKDWAETEYREWHLGDQHRKGSSLPAALEEQGVSVEFIPGITMPNEWHRLKAFNHQKRGAMAFVYDFHTGPVARFQHNINQFVSSHIA